MINLYLDLDDTTFDFSRDFVKFANERYGKEKYVIPDKPEEYSAPAVFGMTQEELRAILVHYVEQFKFATQPLLPGVKDAFDQLIDGQDIGDTHFITVRNPESFLQTLARLQDFFYNDLGNHFPGLCYSLHMANSSHHKKWQIINTLHDSGRLEGGVFIDDAPDYINDVAKHCPGIVTIWMNTLSIQNGAYPHYEVNSWEEVMELLERYPDFKDLVANSKHPGTQLEIK